MPLEHSQLGHYQLLQHIGKGGTGAVYLAQDVRAPRQVAVKMLGTDDISQDNQSEIIRRIEKLFEHEIQTIARLDHPHILSVLDFGTEKIENTSYAYVVMPYRPAGSLASWLTQTSNNSCLPLATIASMLAQIGEALHYAHEHGIMHQDIKPTNILLNADSPRFAGFPDLLLSDFSIARLFATNSSQGLSQSSYMHGIYLFLAPEQWDGKSVPASDQYALAILAFYLLTGKFPFYGSLSQVIRQHYQTPPPAPGSINTQLDPAIDKIIQRALAKQPEKRFPSILDFAQAFAPFQSLADALPPSQVPSNVAAAPRQSPALLPVQPPVQRPQTPSALPAIAALPLAQGLSQDALATPNQKESTAISPVLPAPRASTEATSVASKPALSSPNEAPGASKPAQASPDKTPVAAQPSPDETLSASKSTLLAQTSPDETLIGSKRAQASPDETLIGSKRAQASPDETLIGSKRVQASPVAAQPAQTPPDETLSASKITLLAQASPDETLIGSKRVQASPDETLIGGKPGAVSPRLPTQAPPDVALNTTRSTQIASESIAQSPNKSTQQASLPDARQGLATPEAKGGAPANNNNAQPPAAPPTALAANSALSETRPPVFNSSAPTVLAANVTPVPNRPAPPLPNFQFHEPQMQFRLPAMRRKSVSTVQKSLVIVLIVLVVVAASGAFLFKSLAGYNVSAASNKSNGNSHQTPETIQMEQPRAGGIVTPTSTNIPTPTTTTTGSQSGSMPGSQPGSTPGATSTPTHSGSTDPTAQPTSPVAQPTTAPAPRPTATPTPKPAPPTPTPKPAPTATPIPHGCDVASWSSTLSPTYAAGGTERFVSSYCSGVVSITWTSAPPSGGHQVETQICYGQRTSNCSAWVVYTGVNVWHVVATGRSSGQGFYINNRCQACTGSSFKIYGSIKY